jgi:hypothetical protein
MCKIRSTTPNNPSQYPLNWKITMALDTYFYDLMDAAYDAARIDEIS